MKIQTKTKPRRYAIQRNSVPVPSEKKLGGLL